MRDSGELRGDSLRNRSPSYSCDRVNEVASEEGGGGTGSPRFRFPLRFSDFPRICTLLLLTHRLMFAPDTRQKLPAYAKVFFFSFLSLTLFLSPSPKILGEKTFHFARETVLNRKSVLDASWPMKRIVLTSYSSRPARPDRQRDQRTISKFLR